MIISNTIRIRQHIDLSISSDNASAKKCDLWINQNMTLISRLLLIYMRGIFWKTPLWSFDVSSRTHPFYSHNLFYIHWYLKAFIVYLTLNNLVSFLDKYYRSKFQINHAWNIQYYFSGIMIMWILYNDRFSWLIVWIWFRRVVARTLCISSNGLFSTLYCFD